MNDETPFLDADLVSAYLDNEVTAEERARVDASPELLARVTELTRLRASLRSVEPAPASARESAFAAAMAAFGTADTDTHATTDGNADTNTNTTSTVAPVVSLAARRQRMYRVVTGVAAASVLAVAGLAALNKFGTGDDRSESAAFETFAPTAKAQTAAPAETTAPAEVMVAGGAPAETAAPAETTAAAESAPAVEMAAEADTAAAPFSDLPVLANDVELAAYVAATSGDDIIRTADSQPGQPGPADVVADPFGAADVCPALSPRIDISSDRVLGLVLYAGEQAFVVRRGDGSVQVVSAFTCAVLTQLAPG